MAAVLSGCSKSTPVNLPEEGGVKANARIRFKTDWYPQAEHGGFYLQYYHPYTLESSLP